MDASALFVWFVWFVVDQWQRLRRSCAGRIGALLINKFT